MELDDLNWTKDKFAVPLQTALVENIFEANELPPRPYIRTKDKFFDKQMEWAEEDESNND